MIIEVGTDRYKELFGDRDLILGSFVSKLPPHRLLVEAIADPSKRIDVIDAIVGDERPEGLLHSQGLQDLQLGTQFLVHARASASKIGETLSLPGNGVLTAMTEGIVDVMKTIKIPARASDQDVQMFLADATFAIGMKALGAIGPVGKIAAAILGFARSIYQLVRQRKEMANAREEQRRAYAYAKLPPLQEPDIAVDSWYVDQVLRPKMEGGSWTAIFSPRFESDEWQVLERNGGFAMAPGEMTHGVDDFGEPIEVFSPTGGIGLIPGLDQITSVIQVTKNPGDLRGWDGTGQWPIRPEMVTDVGQYFVNTGRLGAIAWSWATAYDASPDLYKLHVAVLHEKWQRYCNSGLHYLKENAVDWYDNDGKKRIKSGKPKFTAGSAIGCAIGAWRCMPEGNGLRMLTTGLRGDAMKSYGYGRELIGCVMDPPSIRAFAGGKSCLYTLYDLYIKGVLDEVAERQRYFLRHSLVSAYVRADFDAFKDKSLREALMQARKLLLVHPDRMLVSSRTSPSTSRAYPGAARPGASSSSPPSQDAPAMARRRRSRDRGPQPGTLEPTKDPPPKVPVYDGPMAWGDVPEDGGGGDRGRRGRDPDLAEGGDRSRRSSHHRRRLCVCPLSRQEEVGVMDGQTNRASWLTGLGMALSGAIGGRRLLRRQEEQRQGRVRLQAPGGSGNGNGTNSEGKKG
ncbi:MAG: hypothetical protein R3B09_26745 [Nannocystaceae bacterium]